jgi:two-component system chemotaxis sensor kinase CheA
VSALSGRGVGLDVVRREIMALGGRIMISSTENKGTTFTITLPLTLAVLEGMLIQLCDQTMVLPITAVQEALRPDRATLHSIGPNGRALSNRGELIPIIDLACVFGLKSEPMDVENGVLIVVETDGHKRAALQADAIVDQRQVVIKSLEENHEPVLGVSAATILGDGKIALIIDPEALVTTSSSDAGRERLALAANG